MKTIFLHIGTFKTGTSSIQNFITDNREALGQMGYLVPESQGIGHHELPISLIKQHSDFRGPWPKVAESSERIWGRLIAEIDTSPHDKVVLSAESFCDLVNEHCREASDQMGQLLEDYLGKYRVVVICYVRSIFPYMRSMYGETIKITPRYLSFEEQVDAYARNESFHLQPTVYLDFFENLFGRESMVVREYSRDKLAGGDVVQDFTATIGLGDEVKPLLQARDPGRVELNTSIGPDQLDLKRAFNLAGTHGPELNRQVADLIKGATELAVADEGLDKEKLAQKLTDLINCEQEKLNTRYHLELPLLEDGDFSMPREPRQADYLYLVALLGLSVRHGRDTVHLARENKEALRQNKEILERLEQQNLDALAALAVIQRGFPRRALAAARRLIQSWLAAFRRR